MSVALCTPQNPLVRQNPPNPVSLWWLRQAPSPASSAAVGSRCPGGQDREIATSHNLPCHWDGNWCLSCPGPDAHRPWGNLSILEMLRMTARGWRDWGLTGLTHPFPFRGRAEYVSSEPWCGGSAFARSTQAVPVCWAQAGRHRRVVPRPAEPGPPGSVVAAEWYPRAERLSPFILPLLAVSVTRAVSGSEQTVGAEALPEAGSLLEKTDRRLKHPGAVFPGGQQLRHECA